MGVAETTPKPPLEPRGLWGRDLPGDFSVEILSRLLVKSLIHCKCISKSEYAIVTNPSSSPSTSRLLTIPTEGQLFLGVGMD
jgi:hypothetical protein